jgi:MSHA pilin protein MshC
VPRQTLNPKLGQGWFPECVVSGGFTLVELIAVLLLLGILGMFVAPRIDISFFREQGFYQQAQAATRFAQKLAISSGCVTRVQISNAGCTVTWNVCAPASGNNISNPATGLNDFCANSDGTVPAAADISFDAIGRPVNSATPTTLLATQNVTINGRTLRVEAQTGYAHEP